MFKTTHLILFTISILLLGPFVNTIVAEKNDDNKEENKPKEYCKDYGGKWNEKKNTCESFPDSESQTNWEDTVCDDPKDTDRYPEVCQPDSKEYAEQQERAQKVDLQAREKILKEHEEWQKEQEKKRAEYGYVYDSYEEYNEIVEPLCKDHDGQIDGGGECKFDKPGKTTEFENELEDKGLISDYTAEEEASWNQN